MRFLKTSVLAVGLLSLIGCQTVPRYPVHPVTGHDGSPIEAGRPLRDVCAGPEARYVWDPLRQVGTIQCNNKTVQVMVDSRIVLIDGDIVVLSQPVFLKDSVLMVGQDFVEKVFKASKPLPGDKPPVIQDQYVVQKIQRIIIDPGHGGKDPGAIGRSGLKEKDVVLDIALRLERLLRRKGFKVKMTRDKDVFVSLKKSK